MEDLRPICDIATEGLVVGCFFKDVDILMEHEDLIYPEWDFYDNDIRFFYNLVREIYRSGNTKIDEVTINIFLSKDPEKLEKYKSLRGYATVQKLIEKANEDDFQVYYMELKKYNLLRELDRQGFPIRQKWDKVKNLSPEAIYKYFDYGLTKTFSHYEGISGSEILGKNMLKRYENWRNNPDTGIELPFYILNTILRGWRLGKLNSIGLHSGYGKSRMMVLIAMHIGIVKQIPLLIICNEQEQIEFESMLLCAVVNNLYGHKMKNLIDEGTILLGNCDEEQDMYCRIASEMIEKRSRIYFQEANVYDSASLKRILKIHKLRGVNHFIYDTFKPFRDMKGETWDAFVKTSEDLKKICGSRKKGGLDMGGWITFQLTDASIYDTVLTSQAIASGKNIKHNLDFMGMLRPVHQSDYHRFKLSIFQKGNPLNKMIEELDPEKKYYIMFNDKNRGGKDKQHVIYEVDKGKMIFTELGFAHYNDPADKEAVDPQKKFTKRTVSTK